MTASPPSGVLARCSRWVTRETAGGAFLLVAALIALVWANSPWHGIYQELSGFVVGPAALHLDLPLAVWASDGLLAIFFFLVGVELKHELVAGSLRNPRQAALPALAAVGGMVVPAGVYVAVALGSGQQVALHGWAIPTATDIAFALAVLAAFGRGLPVGLRVFLLTLAVVDDLLAILVIAVAFTESIALLPLGAAAVGVAVFAGLIRMRTPRWWLLVPVAIATWAALHASGVHATIAGVALGLVVPASVPARDAGAQGDPDGDDPESRSPAVRLDRAIRPFSAGFVLPVFAFFAAGVTLGEGVSVSALVKEPVGLGVLLGLIVGKPLGILGVAALATKFTPLRLPDAIGLRDLLPIGLLAGMGFTVSLLIAELSFADPQLVAEAKLAVLTASCCAALLAVVLLRWDARKARTADMNLDGIPDRDMRVIGGPDAPHPGVHRTDDEPRR